MSSKEYRRKYYQLNKEKESANSKKYGKTHAKEISENKKEYYQLNQGKILSDRKAYFQANKEKIHLRKKPLRKAYYGRNKLRLRESALGWQKAWRANNPEESRLKDLNHRIMRTFRFSNPKNMVLSREQYESILNDCDRKCTYCGSEERLTFDHVMPISKGGIHEVSNLTMACLSCNSSKGNKLPVNFIWDRLK